ncbi:MAG: glycosyltransferase family 2 protein [Planctomycetota bacterium]
MSIVLNILALSALVIAGAGLVYWLVVLWRVQRSMRPRPTIRAGLDLPVPAGPDGPPTVSIIIPVHNEQRVIDACAASLREQDYPRFEIVFVLDRCTDDTARLLAPHAAADDRIKIVENDHRPEDWPGKCHAAHIGAEHARGEWLLFTDADTQFEPGLVRAAVALAADRDFALLSLLSTLTYHHAFEHVAQPVATMALVRMFPLRRSRGQRPRPFANGQFMLFQREWYDKVGGHAGVRDILLEDLRFARLIDRAGGGCGVMLADGMLTCSMYDSRPAFENGWKRIFIEATNRRMRRLRRTAWGLRILGVGLPLGQASCVGLAAWLGWLTDAAMGPTVVSIVLLGLLVQSVALARIYRASGAPIFATALFPLGAWLVGRIMIEAAIDLEQRRPVEWGGMQYVLEPRPSVRP